MEDLESWIEGVPYEVAFWNNVCRWNGTFNRMMAWSNYGAEIKLDGYDVSAEFVGKPIPVVLDVGCGMSYATGNMMKRGDDLEKLISIMLIPLLLGITTFLEGTAETFRQ